MLISTLLFYFIAPFIPFPPLRPLLCSSLDRVVYLVRRKGEGGLYAMKIMKKELLRRKNMIHQGLKNVI